MKKLEITLEQAKEWYKIGTELRESALKLYTEQELTEKYIPKKDEFYVIECKDYTSIYRITNAKYNRNLTDGYVYCSDTNGCYNQIHTIIDFTENVRSATEEEKQLLISKVESKYNKTWDGKNWVNITSIFRKGDYVKYQNINGSFYIQIYNIDCLFGNSIGLCFNNISTEKYKERKYIIITRATPDEIKLLDDALLDRNKKFNRETLEIEDIFKKGDLVMAWDKGFEHDVTIGVLSSYDKFFYIGKRLFSDAIKINSLEQLKHYYK